MSATRATHTTAAGAAAAERVALSARKPRRRRAALAIAQSPKKTRRAAVVLRRGMKQSEFRRVEARLESHKVGWSSILCEPSRRSNPSPDVCGLVVTGADLTPSEKERATIVAAVHDALARGAPILAMSNASALVLDAAGFEGACDAQRGVLIRNGVQALDTRADIEDAVDQMAGAAAN
ncbi:MAG: hypothetical protein AB7O04_16180 [Hyphomonadaceae bacterium]